MPSIHSAFTQILLRKNVWNFLRSLIFFACVVTHNAEDWCYEGSCGPKHWNGSCKTGKTQSPINIILSKTTKAKPNRKLTFSSEFYEVNNFEMQNNGKTLQIMGIPSTPHEASEIRVKGAGWIGTNSFLEMHFHWESEHLVNGNRYPLELQIVFKQEKQNGGLGVVSILYGLSSKDSKILAPIVATLANIKDVSVSPVKMANGLNLSTLLPPVWDVFRYQGSVTTPPCEEPTMWSVFTKRMPISQVQLNAFTKLHDHKAIPIKKNFRPIQPTFTKTRQRVFWMQVNKKKMIESVF